MRLRRLFALTSLAVVGIAFSAPAFGQDFDPRGRKKPAGQTKKPGGSAPARPGAGRPGSSPAGQPGPRPTPTGEDGGDASAQIAKYTKIALAQPAAPMPLQRLTKLYREKDGNLGNLVKDFEARSAQAGPEQYAAMVLLAGIYKIDGRADDAIKTYEKAIALKNNDPAALLALARLLQDRGDAAAARKQYESALALQTAAPDKEQTLRTLMMLSLDEKDFTAAKGFHQQLVKMQPTSLFVRGELGRELFQRAEFEKAEAEFKDLVAAAAGDNRALAPALKDLGKAQAKAHKNQEALASLKKALASAGQEAAVRAEIYETITEIYRADQQLPILIKQIEDEHPNDFQRLSLLGALYEETGDSVKAIEAYKKALAINPKHIDLRLKMIHVLQSQGELDRAIAEYEALIRAAPNNPQFVFDHADALMQRGDRARALKLLTELEARGQTDEEILSRLADFYGRIGENDRSLKVLTRLAQVGANDPGHLVDLGDHYYQEGNHQLAVQTWKRILTTVNPRGRALAALGDVYLEHDMLPDALAAYREAVQLEPQNLVFRKQLAGALERSKNYREARVLWQELAEKSKQNGDKILAREARTRIVALWGFERILEAQVAPLQQKFSATPPDVDAGRMLAEVQLHTRKFPDAESTLRRVITVAPGDADSYLALERVLVQQNNEAKLQDAIAVLEKLVAVEPKRARELYQRMAQYALQLRHDDDAIKYAARAVELNPDDAEGHKRLGEMYRDRQDPEHAIVEFRAAIAKNDRLYIVYLELADLLLSKGQGEEADRLLRRVIRGAPDEEVVAHALRQSMSINQGKGTLESLEQELLPLAIGNPQRKVYRRWLVDIYGSLSLALVPKSRGTGKDAEEARAALSRIGGRAVKPLLDALADGDAGQQRVAIDVLGYVQNKNAGTALFAFATGQAEAPLRTRAMLACGALRDPALLPKYEALIFPKQGGSTEAMASDNVATAASWAVAKLGDRKSVPLLRRIAQNGTPNMRAFAVLGLGALKDRSSVPLLATTARSPDAGAVARAASAYALGELGADSEATYLATLADGTEPLPRQMAMLALARMGTAAGKSEPPGGKAAIAAIANGVFAGEGEGGRAERASEAIRRAASASLVLLATKGANDHRPDLPTPDESVDAELALDQLVPRTFSAKDRALALVTFAEPLQKAAQSAMATSSERASAVLDAMAGEDGAFEPFVGAQETPETSAARAKARDIARSVEPSVIELSRHPDPNLRTKALGLLARSTSDQASAAMAQALTDPNENVQRVALAAIGKHGDARTVASVAKVMHGHGSWAMRVLAAEALGRLGVSGAGASASKELREAATKESYALVREAALVALASFDKASAASLATTMAESDPEPRVRETAVKIRAGK
ncbi:PBS lyase HEAT domain protein repeat-containing protein [Labilithrix luteola]|uniref:PBS lyase HEAT domain protein repeat-containing protein n=1 Tax=Labilithrix luteola TaxID=1391654 RepID=A0A0K1PUF6_9BACT|nr:tetratricopeptide repeat protein [Labilithrix luteola]AKU96744.1 PBS lyase HEAT domain protein repeat-containing protein [Labilithrix luteola]